MSRPAHKIELHFNKVDNGQTDQGEIEHIEVTYFADGDPDTKDDKELFIPDDSQFPPAVGQKYLDLELVKENPYCINIGGRKYCF